MKNPPAAVKVVMEVVCMLLGVKPKKVGVSSCMLLQSIACPCLAHLMASCSKTISIHRHSFSMPCFCLLLQVNDPANPARKIDDYWTPSQGLLGDPYFMGKLQVSGAG
jgi:hypothetical protein